MIAVILGDAGGAFGSLLAENLAVLRRSAGRRVLLVDAAPAQACRAWARARAAAHLRPLPDVLALRGMGFGERLQRALGRHHDVLVGAGSCDDAECRSALAAAQLAIVPIAADHADPARHYRLIARLNAARMANPALRVLFAAVSDDGALAPGALARVRAYAREVMGGRLAQAVLPAQALCAHAGMAGGCACDGAAAGAGAALAALCGEAFGGARAPCSPRDCDRAQTVQG